MKPLNIHIYLDGIGIKDENNKNEKSYDLGKVPKMEATGIYLTTANVDSSDEIDLIIDALKEIKDKIKLLGWYPDSG